MAIEKLRHIAEECSEYIDASSRLPLVKKLPCNGTFIRKVKVRQKREKGAFAEKFNDAFNDVYNNIHGRSVICNSGAAYANDTETSRFFVFPINGFKFLFNPSVEYHRDYMEIYHRLESMMSAEEAHKIFVDMIGYSYKENTYTLEESLFSKKEIIVYNIAYYYAVKVDKFPAYDELIEMITDAQRYIHDKP